MEKIKTIQQISDATHERNLKKQAEQISYCILQAEEYYHAAQAVSVAIKPLLLYYGSVALSQALVLLTNSGELSLDFRRSPKGQKHNHHGLKLEQSLPSKLTDISLQEILHRIQCTIYHKGTNPWGQFSLFYKSLIPSAFTINLRYKQVDTGELFQAHRGTEQGLKQLEKLLIAMVTSQKGFASYPIPQGCAEVLPIDMIKNNVFTCFDLVTRLADCYFTLQELGMRPHIRQGRLEVEVFEGYAVDAEGNKTVQEIVEDHSVVIGRINEHEHARLRSLLTSHKSPFKITKTLYNPALFPYEGEEYHLTLHARVKYQRREERGLRYYLDMVDDVHGNLYYIIDPDTYLQEPASLFMIQYCFGMLSRYSPDLWMKLINEHISFREFTDTLLQVIERKFPNLILDQMTRMKHHGSLEK